MFETINDSAFTEILTNDTPILDVRSPSEFRQGSVPGSVNLPLLFDEEREQVGKTYKLNGKEAAIELGNKLVSGKSKAERMASWLDYISAQPQALLCCFRGGLRSQTVQQWLSETGTEIVRIDGGYKLIRQFLLKELDRICETERFVIVAGKTGTGKTHIVNSITSSVDLEGIARHRGSAFGRRISPQPSPANFENELIAKLLKIAKQSDGQIFLEDESRSIGALSLPKKLHATMQNSPLAVIEADLDYRVATILNDYIISNYLELEKEHPQDCEALFEDFLLSSLEKIRKRLGEERYQKIHSIMVEAISAENTEVSHKLHETWIRDLLKNYYDPMYEYQLNKKLDRLMFRGDKEEFSKWSSHLQGGLET